VEKELEPIPETVDRIATQIVDACFHLHSRLGPGLLESVYETCLTHELTKRGLRVERQVPIPIIYDDLRIEAGFKIDLLVEGSIILEIKAATEDHPVFKAQLLTYMKLTGIRLGFLINFNKKLIKDGIQRVAL
jgi:GxxExxY protein